jgi:putative aldouronate transport system permease protein
MKVSTGEKIFRVVNTIFLTLVAAVSLFPILNIVARSLSSIGGLASGRVFIWPIGFHWDGWLYILKRTNFIPSLKNSVFITAIGTATAIVITTLTAYALSKPHLKGRRLIIFLYVFFMIFDIGIVPNFFQIKQFGLFNTRWALILPTLINPYYLFVLKTSLEQMPDSLEEAARIDGATHTQVLWHVVIPVSTASIATIVVFFSVNYWNKYFDALMYITDSTKKPITLFLYELIKLSNLTEGTGEIELAATISPEIMDASAVVLTVLPILAVYPLMQRYFVKGVMVGSIKG